MAPRLFIRIPIFFGREQQNHGKTRSVFCLSGFRLFGSVIVELLHSFIVLSRRGKYFVSMSVLKIIAPLAK